MTTAAPVAVTEAMPAAPVADAAANPADLIQFSADDGHEARTSEGTDAHAAPDAPEPKDETSAKPRPRVEEPEKKPTPKDFIAMRKERKELEQKRAALEAERKQILEGRSEWESLQAERKKYAEDPGAYLEWYAKEKGITPREAFQRITQRLATGSKPTEEVRDEVKSEVDALKRQVEEMRAEKVQAAREAAVQSFKSEVIAKLATAVDDMPLLAAYDPKEVADFVFRKIDATYRESGGKKVLDPDSVLSEIHSELNARHEREAAALAKRGARTQPATSVASRPGVNPREATRPISNDAASQRSTVVDEYDPAELERRALDAIQFRDD